MFNTLTAGRVNIMMADGDTACWLVIQLLSPEKHTTHPSVLQELVAVVFLSEEIVEDVVVSLTGRVPQ